MNGHVRKASNSTWSFVLDAGKPYARRCNDCGKRYWVDDRPPARCVCGGELASPKAERRQRWISGFKTKKEAERELRRRLGQIDNGQDPFPEQITVADYLERWLGHQSHVVRPGTLRRYKQLLNTYVTPTIGTMQLSKVRPAHVQACIDGMREHGLAPGTITQARAAFGCAMRQAMEWGITVTNPVSATRRPRSERPHLVVPTPAQLTALMAKAEGTVWAVPIMLSVATGARRGEVTGLRWSDIDLETGRVRITGSLQRIDKVLVRVDPKTDRARREITLPAFAVARLKRHRKEQAARRLALGPEWHDSDAVCDRGDGQPVEPDSFSQAFKRIAETVGLKGARLHDVRHGTATALLSQGVHPAIASAVLGHANPAFTMSQYQHVLDGMTDQAAVALGEALSS